MHSRFFNYSDKAPANFKQNLEKNVATYDKANDGATYTPYATSCVITLLGIVSGVLTNINGTSSYSRGAVYGIQIAIPVLSTISGFIMLICKKVSNEAEVEAKNFISEGVKDGFFNSTPSFPVHSSDPEALPLVEGHGVQGDDLHRDAVVERILKRNP